MILSLWASYVKDVVGGEISFSSVRGVPFSKMGAKGGRRDLVSYTNSEYASGTGCNCRVRELSSVALAVSCSMAAHGPEGGPTLSPLDYLR